MSHYGTHPDYERGFEDGYEQASEAYRPLLAACRVLLRDWQKNLTEPVQEIARLVAGFGDEAQTSDQIDS